MYTIHIVSMQIHSNKQENYGVNVAKMIELYETNSTVRQLYRRQECHYPAQFSEYLLTGLSFSNSLRMDLPSMSKGISTPAMSSKVGARSMFRTM